jgi:hypothetical protein
MAGMRMNGHDHSPVKSSLIVHTSDADRHVHELETVSVDDLGPADKSAGTSDHSHDGVESSCCVMCHFAVEMPFPTIVQTCSVSVVEPPGLHSVRPGLVVSFERPPRTDTVHTG